ncbi:MAG TPA: zinc metallopeptidase [Haliscomenobacter sp.]|uniref:zinc metallopeptidase n=1 Tax=Haliscomenobacter sp. TaxID=2717303 RepID=UPI001DDE8978|nr:zinc metallopeptidase [Haliscomenobacter sp.]MBK9488094.1 zinc metallopeptidase [Haliscomenobacter sp.]HOY15996.1 zinc metallopeptidase [Haliscomenobacter sp.]HPH18376.1 zinc metallopeptidase [Haliscomenobacter sp.]
MMNAEYLGFMLIGGFFSIIGFIVSARLQSKFKHYSQIRIRSGLTGKEIAEAMLRHYGIHDVQVVPAQGMLTDHYNPATKTVALSEAVYATNSIAAAAVAAHECGHAVQHATAYSMLQLRSRLVPIVNFSAMTQQWLLIGSFMLINTVPQLLLITAIVFGVTALFSFVTLPVEFDASRRALAWLNESGMARGEEYAGAKDALWWAAMTYVVAAISALVMVVYLLLRYLGASRD